MFGPWMQAMAAFPEQIQAYQANRAIPGQAPLALIAEAALFLASDASRHCTGVDLPVDGGAHAGRFIAGFNSL
jgi:NAD(P)-dependent dehydrogenase (short-subunit alcohol dehydrogenase family)